MPKCQAWRLAAKLRGAAPVAPVPDEPEEFLVVRGVPSPKPGLNGFWNGFRGEAVVPGCHLGALTIFDYRAEITVRYQ